MGVFDRNLVVKSGAGSGVFSTPVTLTNPDGTAYEPTGGGGGSLADGSVTTAKLADGAVTYEKIADGSIGTDKINSDFFSQLGTLMSTAREARQTAGKKCGPSDIVAGSGIQVTPGEGNQVTITATGSLGTAVSLYASGVSKTFAVMGPATSPETKITQRCKTPTGYYAGKQIIAATPVFYPETYAVEGVTNKCRLVEVITHEDQLEFVVEVTVTQPESIPLSQVGGTVMISWWMVDAF